MNKKVQLPFGLQFEEYPVPVEFTPPIYDEDEELSFYIDENGRKVPAVEWRGNVGTKTFTHVEAENTDEDRDLINRASTGTATKIQEESSDSDSSVFLALSTQTETFVQSEQTDNDSSAESRQYLAASTKTSTAFQDESNDED